MNPATITSNITAFSSRFLEREEVLKGMYLAALTGEHVFLLGAPGTAKSEMSRVFAETLGAKHFEWLLTRFTTPEELFGPVDLAALKTGSFRRVTTGKLPEAETAFLDEITISWSPCGVSHMKNLAICENN